MRWFFSKLCAFAKSLFTSDDTQQQRNNLMDSLIPRVDNCEAYLEDIKEILHRQEGELHQHQESSLSLINVIQDHCDLKFTSYDFRLSGLEDKASEQSCGTQECKDEVALLKKKFCALQKSNESVYSHLSRTDVQLAVQETILQQVKDQELTDLTEKVHFLDWDLQKLHSNKTMFVRDCEKVLSRHDQKLDDLRLETRHEWDAQRHQLEQIEQNFTQAQEAGQNRDADVSCLLQRQGRCQEELGQSVQDLQVVVQKNKEELDAAVDIIAKINCIKSADVEGMKAEEVKALKEELVKVSARVEKMENHVKNHMVKLAKCIEEMKGGDRGEEKEQGAAENEVLTSLQQEMEELRKEKNELAKEVKHLRHARKNEKSAGANLERRIGELEAAANANNGDMKKMQDALQMLTSALQNRVNENLVLQDNLVVSRKMSDKKFNSLLALIEPVVETVVEKPAVDRMLSVLPQNWERELEKTIDEDCERQAVQLAIGKKEQNPVLAQFGDELRLNLPLSLSSADLTQMHLTRRVDKVDGEKAGADRKYRSYYYAGVAAATAAAANAKTATMQQPPSPNYIKMNIRNAGRHREQCKLVQTLH